MRSQLAFPVFALGLAVGGGALHAADLLSEAQARSIAISILQGDPYGTSPADVAKNIKDVTLRKDGKTKACGATQAQVWEFHVIVVTSNKDQFSNGVIDGYLALNARTGKFLCANLPLLN